MEGMIYIEDILKQIVDRISITKGNVYLVGGAVRDEIMGKHPKDYDFCVTGITEKDFLNIFPEAISTGKDFPVFRVKINEEEFEFALARMEKGSGLSHNTNIEFKTDISLTIKDDLSRRDITINSIAKDLKTGEYIDPFGGISDIENGIIRHTSEAFVEDPLRVYRAARFASVFGFNIDESTLRLMYELRNGYHFYKQDIDNINSRLGFLKKSGITIDKIYKIATILKKKLGEKVAQKEEELETIEDIQNLIKQDLLIQNSSISNKSRTIAKSLIGGMHSLSKDRIREEFKKVLGSEYISKYFIGLKEAKVLDVHFQELANLIGVEQPEEYHPEGDAFIHSLIVAEKVSKKTDDLRVIYAALLHDIGKGETPKLEYPMHIGHDIKGVELVTKIGERLGVRNSWIKASIFAAGEHMRAANYPIMRVSKKVDFIVKTEKSKLGLYGLELIVNADDMIGRDLVKFADLGKQMLKEVTEGSVIKNFKITPQENIERFKEIVKRERMKWIKCYSKLRSNIERDE